MNDRRMSSRTVSLTAGLFAMLLATAMPVRAQDVAGPADLTLRGVPAGEATADVLSLSLRDAINRGLTQNLAAIVAETRVDDANGAHLSALADLLPHVSGSVRQTRQVVNLAAFGFTGFPGIPNVIGPFGVFDARLSLSTPLIDAAELREAQAARADLDAARLTGQQTRETVLLVVGSLYLDAVTDRARLDAARAELDTARMLLQTAEDQRAAGVVAGIDVLRQQAQLQAAMARAIDAENAFEKRKLRLARAIGLPADQAIELSTRPEYAAAPPLDVDAGVALAMTGRHDLAAAEARLRAARAERQAATAARLPSLHLDADYGRIGSSASATDSSYTLAASVHVPVFSGGSMHARAVRADADLRAREAELEDLRAGVRFDVRAALLDVAAADARVHVAETRRDLTAQELEQAEDRFRAGVSSSLELSEAQDAVSSAAEAYIASVEAHILAKASLARATGQVEQQFVALVEGER